MRAWRRYAGCPAIRIIFSGERSTANGYSKSHRCRAMLIAKCSWSWILSGHTSGTSICRDRPWLRISSFSFNGAKIITTSGGGMSVSADKVLIDHARKLATQAREPAPHYQHSEIGYNYRLSNLLAAVGRGQLQVLADRVTAKRRIFDTYAQTIGDLPGITLMPEAPWGRCTRWLTCITIDPAQFGADRETVRLAL